MRHASLTCGCVLLLVIFAADCTAYSQEGGSPFPTWVILSGGVTLPVAEFAKADFPSGGYAKTGGGVGVEAITQPTISTEIGVAATMNFFSSAVQPGADGRVTLTTSDGWLIGGIYGIAGLSMDLASFARVSWDGRIGMMYGHIPRREFSTGEASITSGWDQMSASSTVISYGVSFGIVVRETIKVGVDFLVGEPEYEITSISGASTNEGSLQQKTSIVQMRVGYVIPIH